MNIQTFTKKLGFQENIVFSELGIRKINEDFLPKIAYSTNGGKEKSYSF